MENKQAPSIGPSLRACLGNDCSTIDVTIVHNVIVRQQTEISLLFIIWVVVFVFSFTMVTGCIPLLVASN